MRDEILIETIIYTIFAIIHACVSFHQIIILRLTYAPQPIGKQIILYACAVAAVLDLY